MSLSISDLVAVVEIHDVEPVAGNLFRRVFHSPPPDYGKHFAAIYLPGGSQSCLGYIHFSFVDDMILVGGMIADGRAYRLLPRAHQTVIRSEGGIAERLLRGSMALHSAAAAFWGHVGDRQALAVDYRVGFVPTGKPHLIVLWNRLLTEAEKSVRIERIAALGPF